MCAGVAELSEALNLDHSHLEVRAIQVQTLSEIFWFYFYSSPTNNIIFIRLESHWIKFLLFVENINRKIYLDRKLQSIDN